MELYKVECSTDVSNHAIKELNKKREEVFSNTPTQKIITIKCDYISYIKKPVNRTSPGIKQREQLENSSTYRKIVLEKHLRERACKITLSYHMISPLASKNIT